MPKIEILCLKDLSLKGEGNLHVIASNENTSRVFRFPKEEKKLNEKITGESPDLNRIYKLPVTYKKYNVFQQYWGKDYIPKTRISLIPGPLVQQIAIYLESFREESRKHKSMILETKYVEIQPDLTKVPVELSPIITGPTFCIELKLKFGLLLPKTNSKLNNAGPYVSGINCARYCLGQYEKAAKKRTLYCPCDIYSGNPQRMERAIKALLEKPQEKLRVFKDGQRKVDLNEDLIYDLMSTLLNSSETTDKHIGKFCELLTIALKFDRSKKNKIVKFQYPTSTRCALHHQLKDCNEKGDSEVHKDSHKFEVSEGSVLGHLVTKSSLVNYQIDEILEKYKVLDKYLDDNKIEKRECIFDLWNECLLHLDLPSHIVDIVKTIKKYMISLTARDCSIMMCFARMGHNQKHNFHRCKSALESNTVNLTLKDGTDIISTINVIDISLKPLAKLQYNYDREKEMIKLQVDL